MYTERNQSAETKHLANGDTNDNNDNNDNNNDNNCNTKTQAEFKF